MGSGIAAGILMIQRIKARFSSFRHFIVTF